MSDNITDRFLIFRRWRPSPSSEYIFHYAGTPGNDWGICVRTRNVSGIGVEIISTSLPNILAEENEVCTEEEFRVAIDNAMKAYTDYIERGLRPID